MNNTTSVFRFGIALALLSPLSLFAEEAKPSHVVHTRVNIAHKGASFDYPENTLTAFRAAVLAGADGAECDVYRSADGVVFLSHDVVPKRRLLDGDEDLRQMPFEQIRKLDAGAWKHERFKGELVPTLDEFMLLLRGTTCHPVIEIKPPGIAADVVEVVRRNKMVDVSTIISFHESNVKDVRRLEPNFCVAWLYNENLRDKGTTAEESADRLAEFLIGKSRELDVVIVALGHNILSPKLIKSLNESGIHVWAWTVSDAVRIERLLDWGVESIITDRPDVLAEILKRRAGQSP